MSKKNVFLMVAILIIAILVIASVVMVKNRKVEQQGTLVSGDQILENGNTKIESNYVIQDDGTKINISEDINKEQIEVEEFSLTNISLAFVDGMTNFSAEIVNNSEVDYLDGVRIKVTFIGQNDKIIYSAPMMTGTLLAGGSNHINSKITIDCTSASKIAVELVKE